MFGGQHRDDEVTRTEPVGWTRTRTRELRRSARQRKQRDCTTVGVCAKGTKKELNTLDEADFVNLKLRLLRSGPKRFRFEKHDGPSYGYHVYGGAYAI